MFSSFSLRKLVVGVAIALSGVTANALVISDGTTQNFDWSYVTGDGFTVTGTGTVAVSGFNTNQLSLLFTLNNTTDTNPYQDARLTAFGFGINPNATGVTFDDAADGGIVDAALTSDQGQNFPAYQTVEVCAFGGSNCAGGGNGGIDELGSDAFTLLLAGSWGDSVTLDPLALKYQTRAGSYEFSASSSTSSSTTSSTSGGGSGTAPEPGTLSLLGGALLGGLFQYRRRRQVQG